MVALEKLDEAPVHAIKVGATYKGFVGAHA